MPYKFYDIFTFHSSRLWGSKARNKAHLYCNFSHYAFHVYLAVLQHNSWFSATGLQQDAALTHLLQGQRHSCLFSRAAANRK
ncbi:hypothetical protein XENTR_v10004306 [Xenopus tropicalis]|nr:hypothetical protein XENTR_v10004306 [Xenopus tropicalis]